MLRFPWMHRVLDMVLMLILFLFSFNWIHGSSASRGKFGKIGALNKFRVCRKFWKKRDIRKKLGCPGIQEKWDIGTNGRTQKFKKKKATGKKRGYQGIHFSFDWNPGNTGHSKNKGATRNSRFSSSPEKTWHLKKSGFPVKWRKSRHHYLHHHLNSCSFGALGWHPIWTHMVLIGFDMLLVGFIVILTVVLNLISMTSTAGLLCDYIPLKN